MNFKTYTSLIFVIILLIASNSVYSQVDSDTTLAYIQSFQGKEKPIPPLPSGPDGSGTFGAYYTHLKYYPEWDKDWRISEHADVVVRFDDVAYKFVFWRGTNYVPHWITENNIWYNNEFNEAWETIGSSEPMSDKQCRYSHVRIIENNPARVVIHWRYALNDVTYRIAWPDEESGWGDWSDEYYTIYPDGYGIRKVTLHTSHFSDDERHTDDYGHEWHEGIVVYHAYTTPEEAVNIDAVHVANMKGESAKWLWEIPGEPEVNIPEGSNIALMNLKSEWKPFIVSGEGCEMFAYEGSQGGSRFRWRSHWPTTLEPTPGRNSDGKQASHGSFYHITNIPVYEIENQRITKVMLHGMTRENVGDLVPVAKNWLNPPEVSYIKGAGSIIYDQAERGYVIKDPSEAISIVKNSTIKDPVVKINGEDAGKSIQIKSGVERTLEGENLVIWMDYNSDQTITVELK
jgi:hypothetical protein